MINCFPFSLFSLLSGFKLPKIDKQFSTPTHPASDSSARVARAGCAYIGSPKDIQAFIRKARMRWPPPYAILARVKDANITGNLAYRKRDRNLLFNGVIYFHARRFYIRDPSCGCLFSLWICFALNRFRLFFSSLDLKPV